MLLSVKLGRSKNLNRSKRNYHRDLHSLQKLWLGMLFVTIEGFEELQIEQILVRQGGNFPSLIPEVQEILQLANIHKDEIRRCRNATFHFQKQPDKIMQFYETDDGQFTKDREIWAEELHGKLEKFFRRYRYERTLSYAISHSIYLP